MAGLLTLTSGGAAGARHATITLTMDRCSHSYIGEQSEAVATLADLAQATAQEARATGTDGKPRLAEYVVPKGGRGPNGVDSGGPKTVQSAPQSTRRGARVVEGTGLEILLGLSAQVLALTVVTVLAGTYGLHR